MGILSKIWKGVKKVVKKVVKPIAKIFKPITKFFNKFGIVGQIGMMFLMPYAFGALSSFGSAALNTIGGWSKTLMNASNLGAKALGHGLNLVHKAGTMVGRVYSSITETIKGAVDRTGNFLKGRGFIRTPESLATTVNVDESILEGKVEIMKPEEFQKALNDSYTEALKSDNLGKIKLDKSLMAETSGIPTDKFNFTDTSTPLDVNVESSMPLEKVFQDNATKIAAKDSSSISNWLGKVRDDINIFDPESSIRKNISQKISDFDAGEFVVDATENILQTGIVSGAQTALSQSIAEELGYEQPEGATYYSIAIPSMIDMTANNYGVYDSVNLMQSQTGNSWMASNYTNSNSITNFVDSSSSYKNYMNEFSKSIYNNTI